MMRPKLAYVGSLFLVLACGGTTEPGGFDDGGGEAGGGSGGKNTAGSSSAGTTHGGVGAGGAGAASGYGGSIGGSGGSTGGTAGSGGAGGSYDPRCPAHEPSGVCFAPGAACDYNYFTGCLCYQPDNNFAFCTQVDPTCTGVGGGVAAPTSPEGSGGISVKVALPPQQRCLCAGTPMGTAGAAGVPAPSSYWVCSQ